MCDFKNIVDILLGASILLLAAIVACGTALVLNLGLFSAPGATVAFGISLGLGGAANLALLPVTGMLAGCATGPCAQLANEAAKNFGVAAGSLAAGMAISYIAYLTSGVPYVGSGPIAVFAACLVMASVYVQLAIDKLKQLINCQAASTPPTLDAVQIVSGFTLAVSAFAGFILYGLFSLGERKKQ